MAALEPGRSDSPGERAVREPGDRHPPAVADIAERCRAAGAPLHVDAAQSVGHEPVNVRAWGCDLLTASAHKFGGPSGAGVLVVREGIALGTPRPGGRPGRPTGEWPPRRAGSRRYGSRAGRPRRRDRRGEGPAARATPSGSGRQSPPFPTPQLHGDPDPPSRLPHLVSMSFLYVDGEALLDRLASQGVAAASGSACTASSLSPSHVLEADRRAHSRQPAGLAGARHH